MQIQFLTKCNGGAKDTKLSVAPFQMSPLPFKGIEFCVVEGYLDGSHPSFVELLLQSLGKFLAILSAQTIDDTGSTAVLLVLLHYVVANRVFCFAVLLADRVMKIGALGG